MRLAAFRYLSDAAGVRRAGMVIGSGAQLRIHPFPDDTDLLSLLAASPADREVAADLAGAGDGRALTEVQMLPPVYPVAMRDFVTFESHVEGVSRALQGESEVPPEWYEAPSFLFMAPHAVHGAFDDVSMPPDTERLDFELELAVVVSRDLRNADVHTAAEAIGGYCVMNDWTARDVQGREMRLGLGPSKGKDFATTIGPWVITPEELADYVQPDGRLDVEMTVSVNGVEVGRDRSGNMGWSFAEMLSYASRASWVKAGEVVASGTCGGGALAESWGRNGALVPPPLRIGDVVSMSIQGIGGIRNRVVAGVETVPPVPRARRRVPEDA